MLQSTKSRFYQNGYSTLTAVIILGAVAASVTTTFLVLSVTALQVSVVEESGSMAKTYAESCLEEGVKRLYEDNAYAGGETLTFNNGSCSLLAPLGTGNADRTLQATGVSRQTTVRAETVLTTIYPTVDISSWGLVTSF